ncbi:MAG: hypothetical protein R3B45_04625 [Bdellovibrionota bacterium]
MFLTQLKTKILGLDTSTSHVARPFCGNEFIDFICLLLISVFQLTIMPSIFPDYIAIDLLTPWITFAFVTLNAPSSIIHAMLAALLIETHSSVPMGMYICVYWVLGSVIISFKENISWHMRSSWISLLIFSQTWVFLAEFCVSFIGSQGLPLTLHFYIGEGFKIIFAPLFGIALSHIFKPPLDGKGQKNG